MGIQIAASKRASAWAVLAGAGLLLAACGGSSSDAADASDAGDTSTAIWPSNATKAVVQDSGGGFAAPQGSCALEPSTFTLTFSDHEFAWQLCNSGSTMVAISQRKLTDTEYAAYVELLRKVSVSHSSGCGADKPAYSLKVSTPSGDHEYLDSFYACNKQGVYVDGLDELLQAARALAK